LVHSRGEVYRPGNGVETPRLIREVKPREALDAETQGVVLIECVVKTDGAVREDVKVVRSLDTKYGLDEQAIKAARRWVFAPAIRTKDKKPVQVVVTIEIGFTLDRPNQQK